MGNVPPSVEQGVIMIAFILFMCCLETKYPDHDFILEFILKEEQGLNLHEPADVGGKSYAGITQRSYDEWRLRQGDMMHLPTDVSELAGVSPDRSPLVDGAAQLAIVKRFYYDYLGDEYHAWKVPPALQLIYADFAVLSGHHAIKALQELLQGYRPTNRKPLETDGIWGSRTDEAVQGFILNGYGESGYAREIFWKYDLIKRRTLAKIAKVNGLEQDFEGWTRRSDAIVERMERYLPASRSESR